MKQWLPWIAAAVIISGIFITIYGVTQQSLRGDANNPQIQIAEDAVQYLNRGFDPASLTAKFGSVDIGNSLAVFVIVYDKHGAVVSGSGRLHGQVPVIPFGVLEHTHSESVHTLTWQPASSVRLASVSLAANNYYVVSARSLGEVERQENRALLMTALGWLASLVVLAGTLFFYRRLTD